MYRHRAIICNVTLPVSFFLSPPLNTSTCSEGRTWTSLALLSNLPLMGPQTISCFHLLYWFDLRPSCGFSLCVKKKKKNLEIYCLFLVEEAVKEGEKKDVNMPREASLES